MSLTVSFRSSRASAGVVLTARVWERPQAGQIADHLQLFQIARKPSSDRWVGSERRSENSPPQGRMMTLVRRQTMALARKARSANAMQRFAVTIRNGIGAVRSAIDKQTDESIN
jgi:hypothetical protein